MPINKIRTSKRAAAALAAALVAAAAAGWHSYKDTSPKVFPPALVLAVNSLIIPWESLVLSSHWDKLSHRYDICYGETLINGKPVKPGMHFTKQQCMDILLERVYRDYYVPLTKQIKGFTSFPVTVQASEISGSYNFGVYGMVHSSAARYAMKGQFHTSCLAQTAWNKAGGRVSKGLVRRREMGDAQRIGEAELCVSGL